MAYKLKVKRVAKPTRILGLTTLAVAASGLYATTAEASTTHTVRSGEFLQLIGQQHGVSVNQLRQWNNLQTDILQIGQELIVAQPTSTNARGGSSSASGTRVVTASRLNIRSGAGTNHGVIGGLNRNQTVTITGQSNGWYTINHNGRTGFISAEFVTGQTNASDNSSAPDNTSVTPASGTRVVTASRLNVRSGAGTNHGVIGGLNRNQTVTVTGQSNGWYTINHNGRTGFISAEFVTEQTNASDNSSAPDNTSVTPASGTRVVTASRLNVRSGAGTNHGTIGSLSRNQTVTVTGQSNGWYTINHNGRTGFISANFVTEQTGSANNNNASNTANTSNAANASNNNTASATTFNTQGMISFAQQFVGVPYVWGGASPSGFDCSGFIHFVLNQSGVSIPRTNVAGYWTHSRFQTVSNPQPGDLIFFQNTWRSGPSHMGIMINNTQFIHSGSSRGVEITNISNPYWRQHFLGYRRIR